MQQIHDTPPSDMVFERTHDGRIAAVNEDNRPSPHAKQLLLMVNGYTPLRDLLSLLGLPDQSLLADELLGLGLIKPAKTCAIPQRNEWFGKQMGSALITSSAATGIGHARRRAAINTPIPASSIRNDEGSGTTAADSTPVR